MWTHTLQRCDHLSGTSVTSAVGTSTLHRDNTSEAVHPPAFKNPTFICTLWTHVSHTVLLTQWWKDQCQGGLHIPWCSCISICFMDIATMHTLACALEHEFPGETKMMKRTSKPCPERPQAPVLLCFYIHTVSIDTTVTRPVGSLDESTAESHAVMLEAHQLLSILTAICKGKCFSTQTSSSVSFFPRQSPSK